MLKFSRANHWVGIYIGQTHCTLVVGVTSQGKCRLLTLAQSFSLSLIARTLQQLRSSRRIAKFALVVPDKQTHRLHLQLPPDTPVAERHDTLTWLIEQQGFSPLDEWLWDAVSAETPDHYEVLLCAKDTQQSLLQSLDIRPRQLCWLADVTATAPAQENARFAVDNFHAHGPWLCVGSIRSATAAVLLASRTSCA
jgi:hypothetical protein